VCINLQTSSFRSTAQTCLQPRRILERIEGRVITGVRQGKPIGFNKLITSIVDDFLEQDPATRIRLLVTDLSKNAAAKRAEPLTKKLRHVADALEVIDREWGVLGLSNSVRYFVDAHIEQMLPRVLRVMLYQLNVEAILTETQSPIRYQEHMRLAAGLSLQLSQSTETLITEIYGLLISAARKKRNNIQPGGKVSPLKQYAHALCFHYERLHPIWRTVKSIYKKTNNPKLAEKIARDKFLDLGKGERWAISDDRIGLPPKLLEKAASLDRYEASPEYLAYKHAAICCGFQNYTVKQIKRVIVEHKKMMGVEYYNSTFKRNLEN
jgi:hypothetical protein